MGLVAQAVRNKTVLRGIQTWIFFKQDRRQSDFLGGSVAVCFW